MKEDPLRVQNHDKLKSSTLGPNLLNDFYKSKILKKFRITLKFLLLYNTLKTEQKLFLGKNFFVPEKKIVSLKKTLEKKFVSGTQRGGFQFFVILTP